MPKSPNQKLKLLYLMEILLQQTDERHPMTVPEMISELARHGVAAERKSIYNDLESLRTFGLDIVQTKSRTTGYYIGARSFEVPELKLLVDSVQSSKFITHKKTLALIKKIEGLASIYDAQLLQRQVYVRGRVKSMNESVYYNVDEIADAISRDRQIRFHYAEHFTVSLNVVTSPKFYAWLFGFGTDVEILSPPSARQEMQEMLARIADTYARSDTQ